MDPGDFGRGVGVFDAVSGDGVIFHYFSCAAPAFRVYLEVYDAAVFGDAEVVVEDGAFEDAGVYDCAEVGGEGAVDVRSDGLSDDVPGQGVRGGTVSVQDGPGWKAVSGCGGGLVTVVVRGCVVVST